MKYGPRERASRLLATAFGAGFLWPAPGTWGALVGILTFIPLAAYGAPLWVQLLAVAAITIAGTMAAEIAAPGLGGDDPSAVVVDEWAGMWVSLIAVSTPLGWLLAFLLFRLFDIVKPYPAGRFESLHGGVGIMADDLVAGIYTQIAVRALFAAGAWAGLGPFAASFGMP